MNQPLSLDAANFMLAGAREGFGPFLGVYLQHEGFDPAKTGIAMGIAGLAGILATAPLGALIDCVRAKRAVVVTAVMMIAIGAAIVVAARSIWVVGVGQVLIGVADSSLAPIMAALTLGMVGRKLYGGRVARNEAFNHAGNALNAALAAVLGFFFGLGYVALAIGVMAFATSATMLGIDATRIDHEASRGGKPTPVLTWKVLTTSRPLMVLAAASMAFQTANGAMLPFIAQSLTTRDYDPSLTTGAMTVTAQLVMIGASLAVPRLASRFGDHKILSSAFALVVVRGLLAAFAGTWWSIGVVQILEGLAMGLAGVAIPAIVAEIMSDSGHSGAGLGSVMTAYGAGAALSPVLAGLVASALGFRASFIALAGVAALGLLIWTLGRSVGTRDHVEFSSASPGRAGSTV